MKCPNCNKKGPHFVPPSCGEDGFFICEQAKESLTNLLTSTSLEDFVEKENERRKMMNEEAKAKVTHEFYIAGVQFHEAKTVLSELEEGSELLLIPQPENPFDSNAVAIYYGTVMLGFVPRKFSAEVAASLEVGNVLECYASQVTPSARPWEQIKVQIVKVVSVTPEEVKKNG